MSRHRNEGSGRVPPARDRPTGDFWPLGFAPPPSFLCVPAPLRCEPRSSGRMIWDKSQSGRIILMSTALQEATRLAASPRDESARASRETWRLVLAVTLPFWAYLALMR